MSDENAEIVAQWAEFLDSLPEATRAVAAAYPPIDEHGRVICYRTTENRLHHYIVYSYSGDLTVTLVHGSDSSLPGVGTFGQNPAILRRCGCGMWRAASAEQAAGTKAYVERQAAAHRNRH